MHDTRMVNHALITDRAWLVQQLRSAGQTGPIDLLVVLVKDRLQV